MTHVATQMRQRNKYFPGIGHQISMTSVPESCGDFKQCIRIRLIRQQERLAVVRHLFGLAGHTQIWFRLRHLVTQVSWSARIGIPRRSVVWETF